MAAAIAIGTVAAYLVLAATLVGAGLLVMHVLAPVRTWDDSISRSVVGHRTNFWNTLSYWGTFLANTMGVVVVAAIVTVVLAIRRCGRWAALPLCGLGLELATFLTANYLVRRPRPAVAHLGSTPSTFSFPSGHAAATLVLYGGIAFLVSSRTRNLVARSVAWTAAVLLPLWVAFSRVYRGQHHLSDVLAGLVMGLSALIATICTIRASGSAEAAVAGAGDATLERSSWRQPADPIGVES